MSDKKFLDLEGLKHFKDKVQAEIDEKAALPTTVNDKYLHTNATTGEYEWVDVTSGGGTVKKVKVNDTEFAPDADGMVNIGTYLTTHQDISGKLDKNPAVVAGSACKITYDSNGLVTAGGNLAAMDIPNISQSQVTGLTGALTAKQDISTLETDVAAKGFTKNAGTITEIKMNGSSKGTSGVVDLGTVITEHQDITGKLNVLGNETGSGEPYKLPYYFEKTADATQIVVKAHTITMDNAKSIGSYTMAIPSASSSLAGLMSGADKTRLDAIQLTDASVAGGTLTLTRKDGNVTFTKTEVLDSLTSTSTDIALSANKGKELNDRIDNVSSMGRFLSMWDSSGGKPYDDPPGTGDYPYKSGDYYIIGNVSSTGPNYRPDGSVYQRMTSTTVEPDSVHVNDIYRYTTSGWVLQSQEEKVIAFSTIAGQPRDNSNLAAEFDKQIHLLGTAPGSTEQYHFPYNINAIVQNADSISTSFDTVTLDNTKTKVTYPIAIPGADIANNKAGLYTKALADLKADASALANEVTRATGAEATLTTAVSNEKTRAEGAESDLGDRIDEEDARAQGEEERIERLVTSEVSRATTKEGELQTAINGKLDIQSGAPDGGAYRLPYYFRTVPEATKVVVEAETITLDNNKTYQKYSLPVLGASSTLAGLMTAADKVKLDGIEAGSTKVIVDSALSGTSENPVQNKVIKTALYGKADASALTTKMDLLGPAPDGGAYNMTYFYSMTPAADKVTVTAHTITLDNNKTQKTFSMDVLPATTTLAGVMSAADKTKLDAANLKDASVSGTTLTLTRATGGDITFTGGPSAYIKSASVSGNTITLKDQDGTDIPFTPLNIIDDSTTGATDKTYSQSKIISLIEALGGTFFGTYGTHALLIAATGMVKNDYAVVTTDETHSNATTMYYYTGTAWLYAYTISTAPLTFKTILGQDIVGTGVVEIINDSLTTSTTRTYSIDKINTLTADKDVEVELAMDDHFRVSGTIATADLPRLANGQGTLISHITGTGIDGYARTHLTKMTVGSDTLFNGTLWLYIANDTGGLHQYRPVDITVNPTSGAVAGGVTELSANVMNFTDTMTYDPGTIGEALKTHLDDEDIHVTSTEKSGWDAKSTVEGKTAKVTGATELKAINIDGTDWNIPEAGIASVSWGDIGGTLANQTDLKTALDEKALATDLSDHTSDSDVHVSTSEKATWNAKADAATLNSHTTNTGIHVGTNDRTAWNGAVSGLTSHTGDTTVHITADERTAWNAMVPKTDIVNALTQTTAGKVLDAAQGKALNDLIVALASRVTTLESSMSSVQSTVNTIKANYVKAE